MLRLYLQSASGLDSVSLMAANVGADWSESTVQWGDQTWAPPALGPFTVDNVAYAYKEFDVKAIVDAWRVGPNYGLMLLGPNTLPKYARIFASREAATGKPELHLTYHVPAPPTGTWSGFFPSGWSTARAPTCSVQVQLAAGVNSSLAQYQFSIDGGHTWSARWESAACTGGPASTDPWIVTAVRVPFSQDTTTPALNQIQFRVMNGLGEWVESPTYNVAIDAAPPAPPTTITGDRPPSTWTNDASAAMSWSGATDSASGVQGYSFAWSPAADTPPDTTLDGTIPSAATTIPGDGSAWYFHVRAVDHAGNWGVAAHKGPYYLDTVAPGNPTSASCPGHTPGAWSNDNTVQCNWSGATDATSGVAGYSLVWDRAAATIPDAVVDTTTAATISPALADNSGYYLHLRAVDRAGNAAASAQHIGPFHIDRVLPLSNVALLDLYQGSTHFEVEWSGWTGLGAPLAGYDVQVTDHFGTATTSTWLTDTTATSATFTGAIGHRYCFSSRARDAAGNLEAYPSTPDQCTTVGAPVQITVKDEFGTVLAGAEVYHKGAFVGVSDAQGHVTLKQAMFGDQLAVLHKVGLHSAGKDSHTLDDVANWAWRIYRTNIGFDAAGNPLWDTVDNVYTKTVYVYRFWPLIGMHLVVSVEWDATPAYLADLEQGLREASRFLYDVTDGQFFFEVVEVFDNAVKWADADIRIYANNQVWLCATAGPIFWRTPVWGITEDWWAHIHLPPTFRGSYSQQAGYRTMVHEWGHYGLGLWDEYLDRNGDLTADAYCTDPSWSSTALPEHSRASIMYNDTLSSELCSRIDPAHSHRSNTEHDEETGGESNWETVLRRFRDASASPKWILRSPDIRGAVMPGPNAIPVPAWVQVHVNDAGTGACGPYGITAADSLGQPVSGADVWLRPAISKWPVPGDLYDITGLYQGKTDASGSIDVLGARPGDTIWVRRFDYSGSTQAQCAAITAMAPASPLVLAPPPFALTPTVTPLSATSMQVQVRPSVALAAEPIVIVQQDGSPQGIVVSLTYDAAQGTYTGQASLDPERATAGYVFALAEKDGLRVEESVPFLLAPVLGGERMRLRSADGDLELVLRADTLVGEATVSINQAAVGTVRQGELVRVGPVYQVTLAGAGRLSGEATVQMRYVDEQLGSVVPGSLTLYRWDAAAAKWTPLSSTVSVEHHIVGARVTELGAFALLGAGRSTYLPLVAR